MFRVTRPYHNLLGKSRIFFKFSGKKYIFFCILKAKCFTKCIKLYLFPEKKKKYVCLPYLKFSDQLPETHLFFLFGQSGKFRSVRLTDQIFSQNFFAMFNKALDKGDIQNAKLRISPT